MRYLAFVSLVMLMSCATSSKSLVKSNTDFTMNMTAGWERMPNRIPRLVDLDVLEDIQFKNMDANTVLLVTTYPKIDGIDTSDWFALIIALAKERDASSTTEVSESQDIPNAHEISFKLDKLGLRLILIEDENHVHLIQGGIMRGSDISSVSNFIKTFRLSE